VIRAHIVDVMKRKLDTYERFNANFPGFGGFLPWFHTDINTGLGPQGEHWADAVPAYVVSRLPPHAHPHLLSKNQ
jgi:hypothetical protein